MASLELEPWQPDLREMVPATQAFTIQSEAVGGTFAVWITVPPGYADGGARLPLLYVLDGNTQLALTAPTGSLMLLSSPDLIRPFIQVTIGYLGEDARDFLRVRNRDLVPPGEPYPRQMAAHLRPRVDRGVLSEEQYAKLLADLRHSAADRFLDFIKTELHPRIRTHWRADEQETGLFGYSYGGLFAMYAFARRDPFFRTIGASSPGILSPESEVFRLYDGLAMGEGRAGVARLHLTINASEMSSESALYRALSEQYLSLLDRLRHNPLPGLRATAEVIVGETHATGIVDAYRSFLRSCFSRQGPRAETEIASPKPGASQAGE